MDNYPNNYLDVDCRLCSSEKNPNHIWLWKSSVDHNWSPSSSPHRAPKLGKKDGQFVCHFPLFSTTPEHVFRTLFFLVWSRWLLSPRSVLECQTGPSVAWRSTPSCSSRLTWSFSSPQRFCSRFGKKKKDCWVLLLLCSSVIHQA